VATGDTVRRSLPAVIEAVRAIGPVTTAAARRIR